MSDLAEPDPALVDAAARVIDRTGLASLTLSALADEAGLSRVTVHRRGAPLEAYVVAVVTRASDDLRASLWPALTSSAPAADRLRQALVVLCEVFERHSGVMAAVYDIAPHPIEGRPGRTTSLEFVEPFSKLLADGALDGSLVACDDPRSEATLIANGVAWTYLHMRRAHGWPEGEATDRVVDMATARLLPRG